MAAYSRLRACKQIKHGIQPTDVQRRINKLELSLLLNVSFQLSFLLKWLLIFLKYKSVLLVTNKNLYFLDLAFSLLLLIRTNMDRLDDTIIIELISVQQGSVFKQIPMFIKYCNITHLQYEV